jgi:hypothetical protein
LFFTLCLTLAVIGGASRSAGAAPTGSLDLSADRVIFYSSRYIVAADGNVRVRLSDGTVVTGETFAMDLRLNRYLIAGDVHVAGTGVSELGAAFAGYPDLQRSYFLAAAADPDRWTYNGTDFTHPHKGAEQPGDAFYLPDLTGERPYIIASGAFIVPKTTIKFTRSRVYGSVPGLYLPTLSYALNFSPNPNFAQNSLAGAVAGFNLPFNGSAHAVSELGLRYDSGGGARLAFQQHFAWDRDYIVFSINPLTQEERQFNLIGYKRISPNVEARTFLQESTAQRGITRPETASSFENLTFGIGLKNIAVQFNADQYNESLLPTAEFGLERAFEHPADAQLSVSLADTKIIGTPLSYRLRAGIGLAHDGYHCGIGADCPTAANNFTDSGFVLDRFGVTGTPVTTIWQHFFGFSFVSKPLIIGSKRSNVNINATFDKQRQWFSLPHHIDSTTTTFSASKLYGSKLALLALYSISNTGDFYGARQLEFYPAFGPIVTPFGTYDGFNAFRGFSTSHNLTGSVIFTPNQSFAANLTIRRFYDSPAPIPGSFGQPPLQFTPDVRIRLAKQILMDINRTYFFNFANQKWTPQLGVQFGP